MMKHGLWRFIALCALWLAPSAAMAHKVVVFAWVEGQRVHTESKFSGGKRVMGGKIEVFDHAGRRVAEGVTDKHGRFDFPIPSDARSLKVVMTSGMGHSNHWTVTAQELGTTVPLVDNSAPPVDTPKTIGNSAHLDAKAIESIVERALEKKLAPLKAQMAEQAWGFRDIVAGLGYILGLMGLASYMHHRRKS